MVSLKKKKTIPFFFIAYCKGKAADTLKSLGHMWDKNDDTGSTSHFNIRLRILKWKSLFIHKTE